MGSFFEYVVDWYYDGAEEFGKIETAYGVTFAESLSEAIEKISRYYGEDNIDRLKIFTLDSFLSCYDFSDDEHTLRICHVEEES